MASAVARIRLERRQARRRERFAVRLAQAGSPASRVGAAADHLRAVLGQVGPDQAGRIADQVVRDLLAAVERAYQEEEEEGR